jgi:hypothetical protein
MSRPEKPRALPFKEEHQHFMTDPVFLIGNGKSRDTFDLERLRGKGTIIGCNALYRDFAPDILIAIDAKLITELKESKYCEDNFCVTPANRTVGLKALKWRTDRFNTSGCFGMKMIMELMQPTKCYMIGMDGFPGNMYDKTKNYSPNTLQNFSGVVSYYMQVLNGKVGDTLFINVNNKDAWPTEAHNTGHYAFMTFEEFEKTVMAP